MHSIIKLFKISNGQVDFWRTDSLQLVGLALVKAWTGVHILPAFVFNRPSSEALPGTLEILNDKNRVARLPKVGSSVARSFKKQRYSFVFM